MSQVNMPNGIPPHVNGVDSSHSSRDSSPSSRMMQQQQPPPSIPQSQLPPVRQLTRDIAGLQVKQATPSTSPKPFSTSTPVLSDLAAPAPASADVSPIGGQAQLASRNNNTNVPSGLNRPTSQQRLAGYGGLQSQFNHNLMGGANSVGSNSRGSSVNASPVRAQQTDAKPSLINGAQGDFNKFPRPPLNKQMTLPQQLTGPQFSDGVNKTNSLDSVYPYGALPQQTPAGGSQNLKSNIQPATGFPQHPAGMQPPGQPQQPANVQYASYPPLRGGNPNFSQQQFIAQGLSAKQTAAPPQNVSSPQNQNVNTNPPSVGQNPNAQTTQRPNQNVNTNPASVGQRPNAQQAFQQVPGQYHAPTSLQSQPFHNQTQAAYKGGGAQPFATGKADSQGRPGSAGQLGQMNMGYRAGQLPASNTGLSGSMGQLPPINNIGKGMDSVGQSAPQSNIVGQTSSGVPLSNIGLNAGQASGGAHMSAQSNIVGHNALTSSGVQLPPQSNLGQTFASGGAQLPPQSNMGHNAGQTFSGQLPPQSNIGQTFTSTGGQLPPQSNIGQNAGQTFTNSGGQLPPQSNIGHVGQTNSGGQLPPSSMGQFPPKNAADAQTRTNLHAKRYPTQPVNPPQANQQQRSNQVYQPQAYQQQPPAYQYQQTPQAYQQTQGYQYQQGSYPQKSQNVNQNYNFNQQTVSQVGFNKLWGTESYDLLQTPVILPRGKVETPRVSLGNESLDNANCHPDIFRCTMTKIPESNSLLQKSRLPLGVLIHPFRDLNQLPVIQCNTIVRCRACRTYINPFVFFVDNKRWKCNLCYRVNELPEEFQYDPVTKTYGDPSRRPEVKASTIEYIAPAEYMLRPPQPAVYLFLMDVSRAAVESGYLSTVCSVLSAELSTLPGDARTHIGFIAYNSALHFYSLADGLSQPHEMTVLDVDEIFLPCPDNLLVNLQDRMELVGDLLAQLPNRFNQSYDNGSALGAALQAAHKMMSSTGGRVTVFQCALPNIGPGLLNPREDPSQRAGSEAQHLNPANDFYKRLALECSGQQIAVDLFILNSQYVDIATISGISRFSGGCMQHYPLFKASRVLQNELFERSLRRYLTRKIGFEAVMRIRCSRGLSIHTFHGNFFVRSTDLLSLPNVNPDAGFGMQVAIEENLSDVQTVCFQAALLYTSSKGERRIRVHTMCLPIVNNISDIINSADQQCIVGLLAKMAVDRSMQSSLSDAREAFINVAIDILSSYKVIQNMGATSSLTAPNCLRLLPLYISALLKNQAFRTGISTRLDDRVKAMCDMKTRPLTYLIQSIYPDLYPVHNLHEQTTILNEEEEPVPNPPHLHLTARSIDSNGAYLLDTGEHMILLVCPAVNHAFLNQALGVPDYNAITDQMHELPVLDNEHNQRLHMFLNYLNEEKPFKATLQVLRDNSQLRAAFLERLVEDRVETALSYHEFLQHLKTQVK